MKSKELIDSMMGKINQNMKSDSSDEKDDMQIALEDSAEEMMKSFGENNVEAFSSALKSFISMCSENEY